MLIAAILVSFLLSASPALATNYFIATTGSDSNNGLSSGAPWKTFAKAMTVAGCGDTVSYANGTYGDGGASGTDKIVITTKVCTASTKLTVKATNSRQVKIQDSGNGYAGRIITSAYIDIDGIVFQSANVVGGVGGTPFDVSSSMNIGLYRSIFRNPNHYANMHGLWLKFSDSVRVEQCEFYNFHRHAMIGWQSSNVIASLIYASPRTGRISGGFGAANGLGGADALFSMYPCSGCILENSIAEGTTGHPMYLVEMNATYGSNVLMSDSKAMNNICLKCNYGNNVYLASRLLADLNHTPQNITISNNAFVNFGGTANCIRVSDGVNITITHISCLGDGSGATGIFGDDTATGTTTANQSIVIRDSILKNLTSRGYYLASGYATYSGNKLYAYSVGTGFTPALPGNWSNTSVSDPGIGTCLVWIPDGSAAKGAASDGGDIGASVLYLYASGVPTNTRIWNTTTGEWMFGAIDLDSLNAVGSGGSPFDVHVRLKVNTGGCSFPSGYGSEPAPQTGLTQTRFIVEEFNGPEASPSRKAGESVNYTVQVGGCARVRMKVSSDVNISAGPRGFVVWAAPNGGAYAALTDAFVSKIKFSGLGGDTVSETATTEQLTDDEPNFSPGPVVRSSTQSIQINMGPNYDSEVIVLVCIQDTAVPGTDYWDLKLRQVDPSTLTVSDLDVYSAIPRLTTKRMAAGAI